MFNDPFKNSISTHIMSEITRYNGLVNTDIISEVTSRILEHYVLKRRITYFSTSFDKFDEHGWIHITFETNTGWSTAMSIDVKHELREQKINNLLN